MEVNHFITIYNISKTHKNKHKKAKKILRYSIRFPRVNVSQSLWYVKSLCMCRLVRVPLQPELVGVGVQGDGGQSAAGLVHQERGLDIEGT